MLSFFPILLLLAKSFHLFFPSSSSRVALTLRGTLAGRAGPSLALLGSLRAWLARAGLISAAAEITLDCGWAADDCEEEEEAWWWYPGFASALRFRESPLEMGLRSLAVRFSTVAYDLNVTKKTGLLVDPVMDVMRAG